METTCPNCGYCPHCKRAGHQRREFYPVYPYRYGSPYWYGYYGGGLTGITTAGNVAPVTGTTVYGIGQNISFTHGTARANPCQPNSLK